MIDEAVAKVSALLTAPGHEVTAFAYYGGDKPSVMVWYSPRYAYAVADLPTECDGFVVCVGLRPEFLTY